MGRSTRQRSQITLRSLDPRLTEEVRRVAREEGISLNKATLKLLRRGAGLQGGRTPDVVGHSLDHLIGTWDEAEAKQFLSSIRPLGRIDKGFWR